MQLSSTPKIVPVLADYYPRLGMSRRALAHWLAGDGLHVNEDFAYDRWEHLTRYYNEAIDLGSYYLEDDHVVLIYFGDLELGTRIAEKDLTDALGTPLPEQVLRSTAGKRALLKVYATDGLAYAVLDGEVQYIELFQSMTFAEYVSKIYKEPGPWPL